MGLPVFQMERVWHPQTVLLALRCFERTRPPVPGSMDGVCSNADRLRVRERVASFRLSSGWPVADLPANDGVDKNYRVRTCLPRGLFVETGVAEHQPSVVQMP
ncbi:hypothetical protein NPIL_206481 [Nephila pilipes]|uniref:Uncharacterized protein n=1 Tax=Nephila pilipes TaxID=299642 RepID=A0A8X6QBK6_NEPPI|nr:hypothetical protein NPIL_206481 [Nephila pilipes]